jgi:adenylosuccinate lyase
MPSVEHESSEHLIAKYTDITFPEEVVMVRKEIEEHGGEQSANIVEITPEVSADKKFPAAMDAKPGTATAAPKSEAPKSGARDRTGFAAFVVAAFFAVLGIIASSIERLSVEIRHLQRTEVREAEEFFSEGQKGSSAMPHKRNPILTENLTGLARIVRSAVVPAMENVALWHERDISHSSVERMIGPDATVTLDFALMRMAGMMDKLLVYPDTMMANLDQLKGLVHSQRVLLGLTQRGMSREDAYQAVQRNAMDVWIGDASFLNLLISDSEIGEYLSNDDLEELFDLGYHTKHVDTIFKRVFGS